MTGFAKRGLVHAHPLFQLCRGITQPVIKLDFNPSIVYHHAFMSHAQSYVSSRLQNRLDV